MNKKERRIFIKKISEIEKTSEERIVCSLLRQELDYCYLKCCNPEINYKKEFDFVMKTYAFEDLPIPESVIKYKEHLLGFGQPWVGHVGHYDINDTISYIGEYYDGTPTKEYRKEGRFEVTQIEIS